ncbi:hypothetical protein ACH4PR_20695 [Streptomyces mirabilis]|uniref:hypothetical protein n=1 Tax=Streptomyces mirabilis TaxID=68239 RepID=UPI0037A26E63
MSLESRDDRGVPELTARVVRASFPKGTLAVRVREALGPMFDDESFAEAFSVLPKTHLGHIFAATAINIIRLDAWLTATPLGKTRTSHLAQLDLAV